MIAKVSALLDRCRPLVERARARLDHWRGAKPAGLRVCTPTVLQMEAVECGAACLAMVLGHHGRFVPLEELRYACGVSRDGSKASNIVKAARAYGLKAKGFKMEPAGLRKLPLPLVVFWNFNHFVVVEGYGGGKVLLNDPATGPRAVSDLEFDESFTGVALAFETGPEFQTGGQPASAWNSLKGKLEGVKTPLLYLLATSLALSIPALLLPSFQRVYVDYYLIQHLGDWLVPLLSAMVVTALIRMALTWLQQENLLKLQTRLSVTASSRFLWHVLRLPVGFFAQRYGGEIATRVQLNDRVASLISGDLATAGLNAVTMASFALLMLQYDVLLTLVGLAFAAANLGALKLVSRRLSDANQKLLLDRGKLSGITTQNIGIIDSFKASGMEDLFFGRIAAYHAKVVTAEQDLARQRLFLQAAPLLLGGFASAAILTLGGFRVMEGGLTIGMLVAFQMLMAQFQAPVTSIVGLGGQLQEAVGYVNRLDDVLRHPRDPEFDAPAAATRKLSGRVEVRDLVFGFSPLDPPLIEGFSLNLAPGARVALVGGSGSGKSTIGKLLAGFYRPWSGAIRFDDVPAAELGRETLRTSLAIVDQDIALFEGTVRDNLTLWDDTLPDDRMVRAAKDAAIHDVIAGRAQGYDSPVSEGGRNFSGGQCQRIEIARALAAEPTVLILDEATSALDAATEIQVVENLRRRGCTCIIIAHRLSTIRDCDEIVVLERGRIIQRGTHNAMMETDGPYRRLIEH
ncbi:ABC transporter related protein [Magnetospirillum gryphiswaldense MSR-1 v2]|uniref:ABC transporter related protein n=1 Tax=Magnetospirillum gryphiswaldense (strain DSM 6361 / JCM 21280 / NBRC 15271 / MSR-1) TaxID=431944 RepID=V6EXE2_MAGGM|nr:NHLP family bacteriocin export ABC transporter peptidase/permease/ATPase subunit [Magnetospirillum gryphiswaldense]CDK97859.1 ABC transporter related protein [Magnetospirillum gryphiswaldense MSR-1 v2]